MKHYAKMVVKNLKRYGRTFPRWYHYIKYDYLKLFVTNPLKESGVNTTEEREQKIILSLTSFPKRYNRLHVVMKSLLRQTVKPDYVILYLYEDEAKNLPISLTALTKFGMEIVKVDRNLMPHKKYYYAMQAFPNDCVITVDDDFIYPDNLVEELLKWHELKPHCIVAARARKMNFDENGQLLPYRQCRIIRENVTEPVSYALTTNGGGTLFPPRSLDSRVFDIDLINKLALRQDDLWLMVMQKLAGTKAVICPENVLEREIAVKGESMDDLFATNTTDNRISMKALFDYFNITKDHFYPHE